MKKCPNCRKKMNECKCQHYMSKIEEIIENGQKQIERRHIKSLFKTDSKGRQVIR